MHQAFGIAVSALDRAVRPIDNLPALLLQPRAERILGIAQDVAGFVGAVAMGAMFGLIFGLMNVMQDAPGQMERQRGEIVA